MIDFFTLYGRLDKAKVEFHTAVEKFDPSDEGLMLAGMRAWMAKKENSDRVRRTMNSKRGRVQGGKPLPGSYPIYGYEWVDPVEKTMLRLADSDSEPYRTMRRIWDYFLHDTRPTLYRMAVTLNDEGVKSPRAYRGIYNAKGRWTPSTIREMLWNETYWGGDDGTVRTFTYARREGQIGLNLRIPAYAPPYVTPEEAHRVHARLAANKKYATRNAKRAWHTLLHFGIARCGECGWTLTPFPVQAPAR
jgi:hypothetical protein